MLSLVPTREENAFLSSALWKNVCTRPPREIDFHDVVYIPWYSGTRMMDTTTDTIDNAPGLVPQIR